MERETKQLRGILKVLESTDRPLTPEEILHECRKDLPRIGITTIYRKIRELTAEQRLIGVTYPGQPTRYELPSGKQHPHFVCYQCKKVFDLPVDVRELPIELPEGFLPSFQELVVHGLCPECAASTGR